MFRKAVGCFIVFMFLFVPVAAAAELSGLEKEAISLEARGDYPGALDTYKKALKEAAEKRSRTAEPLLVKVSDLTYKLETYAETLAFLDNLDKQELEPVFRAFLTWERLMGAAHLGQVDKTVELADSLGFITDWKVIGPFKNERNTEFYTEFPPEQEIDFSAEYEGKERKVAWRTVPRKNVTGTVPIHALYEPDSGVVAYALAYVKVDEDTDAAVRFSSDDGLRLWVNDALLESLEIHRNVAFEQNVVGAKLKAGWNKILLKVAQRENSWEYRLRFTKPDGTPLKVKIAATDEEFNEASGAYSPAEKAEEVDVNLGAWGEYVPEKKKRQEFIESAADPWALYHAFILIEEREPFDEDDVLDRDLMMKAVELDNNNANLRFHLANALRKNIQMAAEKEENLRRKHLLKALELDTGHFGALKAVANYYSDEMNNIEKARIYVDRLKKNYPEHYEVKLLDAFLLGQKGFNLEKNLRIREMSLDQRYSGTIYMMEQRASRALQADKIDEAEKIYMDMLARDYLRQSTRRSLMRIYEMKKNFDPILKLWEQEKELYPFYTDYYTRMAGYHQGRDELEKAAEYLKQALEIEPEDDNMIAKLGLLYRTIAVMKDSEDYAELAMEQFDRALKINPANPFLKKYREFLSEKKKSFEEKPRFNEDFASLVKAAPDKTDDEGDASFLIFQKDIVKVNRDGSRHKYTHEIIKILTEKGTRDNRVYYCRSYGDEEVKVKTARVVHPDGTEEEARFYGGYIQFPVLQVGDILEVKFRVDPIKRENRFFGDYYGEMFFFKDLQYRFIKERKFVLMLPNDREFYINLRDVKEADETVEEGKYRIMTWTARDVPKITPEDYMPPGTEILPQIQVSTFKEWEEMGKWYWGLIKNQHDHDPELTAKAVELTNSCETDYEKIRAIFNFVVTEIQYNMWEFGIHGYKPYKASAILKRKFGDCKDKAILINTMLREVGIKGYPVLINSMAQREDEDFTLPMFQHFNHCISYVEYDGGSKHMFLDGTAAYHSVDEIPFSDVGAKVLVVTPEGGRVETVPVNSTDEVFGKIEYTVKLGPKGDAELETRGTAKGSAVYDFRRMNSPYLRQLFQVKGQRKDNIEKLYGPVFSGSKALEESIKFSDLKDLNKQVEYSYVVRIPNMMKKTPRGWAVPNTFFPIKLSDMTTQDKRDFDMLLYRPSGKQINIKYKFPPGYKAKTVPEPVEIDNEFGTLKIEYEKTEDGVEVKKRLDVKSMRVSRENYPKFREFVNKVNEEESRKIILEKEGEE